MSASKKLKQAAPWDRWREYCNRDVLDMIESDDMDRLLNALPQIVAVVEAAEAGEDALRIHGHGPELIVSRHALFDALSALDEALS